MFAIVLKLSEISRALKAEVPVFVVLILRTFPVKEVLVVSKERTSAAKRYDEQNRAEQKSVLVWGEDGTNKLRSKSG